MIMNLNTFKSGFDHISRVSGGVKPIFRASRRIHGDTSCAIIRKPGTDRYLVKTMTHKFLFRPFNRFHRVWTRSMARNHLLFRRKLTFQSGRPLHKTIKRNEREVQQRNAAKARAEAARKSVPKAKREQDVKSKRDKRNPALAFQSGAFRTAATVATTLLGVQFWRTLRSAKSTSDAMRMLMEQFRSCKESLTRFLGKALWVVPFVVVVHYCLMHFNILSHPFASLALSALAGFVGTQVWDVIAKFFPVSNDVQLQSGGPLPVDPSVVSKLLSTIMCFSVFKQRMTPYVIGDFMKRITMLDRASAGWETFIRWTMDSIETLVNFVRARFGKERVSFFKSIHKPTYEWFSKVDKKCILHATAQKDIDAAELNELIDLAVQGNGFRESYRGSTMARHVDDYTVRITNVLQPYLGAINARNNFRFEPVAIMLKGAPGIGKTALAVPFCAAVLLLSGLVPAGAPLDDVLKEIWQKGGSDFWNGYARQLCLVMDDAFQQRVDATDKDNEYMSLIRMVGSWSFPLNFADLASKGKIYFGSKMIFGTTNARSIVSEAGLAINEPSAVVRRIGFPYELRLKDDYKANGFLDMDKFNKERERCSTVGGIDSFPWYMWECFKHDFANGSTSNQAVPLRNLVIEVAEAIKKRETIYGDSKDYLQSFVAGFAAGNLDPSPTPLNTDESGELVDAEEVEFQAGADVVSKKKVHTFGGHTYVVFNTVVIHLKQFIIDTEGIAKAAVIFLSTIINLLMIKFAFDIVRAIFTGIYNFFRGLFNKGGTTQQSNRPLAVKQGKFEASKVRFQSSDSTVCTNVYANTYKIHTNNNEGFVIIGQICFLSDTLAVQPAHFTDYIREMLAAEELTYDSTLEMRHSLNSDHRHVVSVKSYLSYKRVSHPSQDVEFVRFEDIRAHRNIVGSFIREADLNHIGGYTARLDVCEIDDRAKVTNRCRRMVHICESISVGANLNVGPRRITRHVSYRAATSSGDCGAVLCLFDNSSFSGRTAIGLHMAGNMRRGDAHSNIITQEMIKTAMSDLQISFDKFEEDLADRNVGFQTGQQLPFVRQGSFLPIGMVEKPVVICPKTSFFVTQHFGSLGDYGHLPAPLSPVYRNGQLVYPMENAVAPYATPVLHYDQEWLEQALHVAMGPFTVKTKDCPRRIYSFEEAILGIPEEKFRSIPRGTAAGFPYVYDVRNGKKEFFGDGAEYDLKTQKARELALRVNYVIDCAKHNERLAHVFVDFLKDELRSPAKVETVATRLISSAPLDYTVAWRMYFGAFGAAAMRFHTVTGMAPGICAYTDWDLLANQLLLKGTKVFDGDFKAFDSSEQPKVHTLILDFVNRWYDDGEDNARIRRVLWLDLMHSRHIGGLGKDQRYIYQWNKSLPSGHPFTTIVNSIYSLFCLVGAYISVTGDYTGFWRHVSAVTYGDDNATNVSEEVAEVFNQVTVADALKREFGMTYTSGKKNGLLEKYTTLEDITFLKRRVVYEDGFWLSPLELESFLYTVYWCKNKKLEKKICRDVLENALEELSMHDQRVWDEYAHLLKALLRLEGHDTNVLCQRDQYQMIIRKRADNWY